VFWENADFLGEYGFGVSEPKQGLMKKLWGWEGQC